MRKHFGRAGCLAAIAAVLLASTAANAADLADQINALRARGCSGAAGTAERLQRSRALDAVAAEWAKGGRLQQALEKTHYRAASSSSMRVLGAPDDRAILNVLEQQYCAVVTNPQFTTLGIARRGRNVWIVIAKPIELPSPKQANEIAREVLTLVNAARAKPRKCGGTTFDAAPPLTLSAPLTKAALQHAQDMARHGRLEHEGSDGSTPAQRVTRAGYRWRHVAENIAAGAPTADAVVRGWLASPGHCSNIMGRHYREMGIAFAVDPKSDAGIYWAQTFATAR